MSNTSVKYISLHHIDKDKHMITKKNVSIADATEYVLELTDKMISNTNMREYKIKSAPNPTISQILNIIKSSLSPASSESAATAINIGTKINSPDYIISKRLLDSQESAQIKYKKITNIKKGSLIQSLVEKDSELIYIIALVEHSSFIDANDLLKKVGLPDSSKATLKSARFHFDSELSLKNIFLSDSSPKISEYWYDGFLDLIESINNISNTKRAYTFIRGFLSDKLANHSKQDHLEYTNSLNVYFSHNKLFNFDECLDFVFNADPINTDLNIESIKIELKNKKNSLKLFDPIFEVDNTDIKNQLTNRKYKLNNNVELKIKSSPDKIKESIYTCRLENGQVVLAIKNVDNKELERFNFFDIDL